MHAGGQTSGDGAPSHGTWLAVLMATYLLVTLALLPWLAGGINPDGISYISISRHILAGDWQRAVNGYWSPLYTWLLVPLLALRLDPILAGRLLAILIGLATLPGLQILASRFALSERLRTVVLAAMLPLLWRFTFHALTPDFLLACLLVWYFALVFSPGFRDRRRHAVLCGALGGLAYFAKAYAFYFFLGHFTLMAILHGLNGKDNAERRAAVRQFALGLVVFSLFAGTWITLLSVKYGGIVVATSQRYSHDLVGPDSPGHPTAAGFLAPADATAISVWDDPSSLYRLLPEWNALSSAAEMKHQSKLVVRNLGGLIGIFHAYNPLALVVLLGSLLCLVRGRWLRRRPGGEAFPLLTLLLYPAGYLLVLVYDRYFFACLILLALMTAQGLQWLADRGFLPGWRRGAALAILILTLGLPPAGQLVKTARIRARHNIPALGASLANQVGLTGRIASNREWQKTLALAYLLNLRYYGVRGVIPNEKVIPALARWKVNYYFVWKETAEEKALFRDYPEMTGGAFPKLRIYQLDARRSGPLRP